MRVNQLLPFAGDIELAECLALPAPSVRPFAPELVESCCALSVALLNDPEARAFPELQALGYWMRRSSVQRMKQEFAALDTENCVLVPRGLVFHIPPGNVDTIFIYSWAVSFLSGNHNIIRLSSKQSRLSDVLVRLLGERCTINNTVVVSYGHEPEITEMISAKADVRIIWGGDDTVRRVRQVPLAPHARELTFPDRTSLAAVKTSAWLSLPDAGKRAVAERLYNDTYWFDQMACSSPRLMIWCGDPGEGREASEGFWRCLRSHIDSKQYTLATGPYLMKLASAYGAILDTEVSGFSEYGNELTVITLEHLDGWRRPHHGGGLFYQVFLRTLNEFAGFVDRRDQTLGTFGFNRDELRALATLLNGRGIDRMVPIGSALDFSRFWDGCDLFQELTRRVYIS